MIYSVNYKSKYILAAGEVRCPYNQLGEIYDLMKEHPEKRYVVMTDEVEDGPTFLRQLDYVAAAVGDNYTVECKRLGVIRYLLGNEYNNVFYDFPVTDWETFDLLQSNGMTDIYIDGPLCFNMPTLAKKKGNTKIRVAPTFSPNAIFIPKIEKSRPITSFYIRPEDIAKECYSPIDIIDFHINNNNEEDILYEIYNRGSYNFELYRLIKNLEDTSVNNIYLATAPDFAEVRSQCKQKCKSDSHCHFCNLTFTIAKNIEATINEKME